MGKRFEHLLVDILSWYRDQVVRALGRGDLLLYPDLVGGQTPVLHTARQKLVKMEKRVEMARLAFQRNMKFSAIFRTILTWSEELQNSRACVN